MYCLEKKEKWGVILRDTDFGKTTQGFFFFFLNFTVSDSNRQIAMTRRANWSPYDNNGG